MTNTPPLFMDWLSLPLGSAFGVQPPACEARPMGVSTLAEIAR